MFMFSNKPNKVTFIVFLHFADKEMNLTDVDVIPQVGNHDIAIK